jgi:hypothetical protein
MNNNVKRVLLVIFLNIAGGACFLLPLLGAYWCAKKGIWILVPLNVLIFFVLRRILFLVENKIGIRSPSNPDSYSYGDGVTFVAPWVKRKFEKNKQKKTTGSDLHS